jgi:uncharacterized phiE125 gp8 family phage protein
MRYRSLKALTPPAVEPVTLAEAKHHCRVDTTSDDAYIASLITAAREWCEAYCDETFVHAQYRMTLDSFPVEIELPRPPMASAGTVTAVSVTYTLENQSTATLSTAAYRVDRDSVPGVLRTNYNGSWPSHLLDYNAVAVTWWGGKGADGSGVEQRIKNAILWLVGLWYERRMAADQASLSEIPFGVKSLLDSAKWGAYR